MSTPDNLSVVSRVKLHARRLSIDLDQYGCVVTSVYDKGVGPVGFGFSCIDPDHPRAKGTKADDDEAGRRVMRRLWQAVHSNSALHYDDPSTAVGWFNALVTKGRGYREPGKGPRLHIELDVANNSGDVHIDGHGPLRADGSMDFADAALNHLTWDLIPSEVGGRIGHTGVTWMPFVSLNITNAPGQWQTVLGLDDTYVSPVQDAMPRYEDRSLGVMITGGLYFMYR